jgi:hypothetical protein
VEETFTVKRFDAGNVNDGTLYGCEGKCAGADPFLGLDVKESEKRPCKRGLRSLRRVEWKSGSRGVSLTAEAPPTDKTIHSHTLARKTEGGCGGDAYGVAMAALLNDFGIIIMIKWKRHRRQGRASRAQLV